MKLLACNPNGASPLSEDDERAVREHLTKDRKNRTGTFKKSRLEGKTNTAASRKNGEIHSHTYSPDGPGNGQFEITTPSGTTVLTPKTYKGLIVEMKISQ